MKINWGLFIIALYISFVAMILALVGMSAYQKMDLVTDHYYEEEVHLQEKINKTARAQALSEPLTWELKDDVLLIRYPKSLSKAAVSGKIKFYCPSNEKNDHWFKISARNNEQYIPLGPIAKGNYYLQIDWKSDDNTFWSEDALVINHLK